MFPVCQRGHVFRKMACVICSLLTMHTTTAVERTTNHKTEDKKDCSTTQAHNSTMHYVHNSYFIMQ